MSRQGVSIDIYDHCIGYASQFCGVDVAASADAYSALVSNPALRQQMGASARQRAVEVFDWKQIVERYEDLWAELNDRRAGAAANQFQNPLTHNPFHLFAHYPTTRLEDEVLLKATNAECVARAATYFNLPMTNFAEFLLLSREETIVLLRELAERGPTAVGELMNRAAPDRRPALQRTLGWLIKCDLLRVVPQREPNAT